MNILNYIKQCNKLLLELHGRENISMPFLWWDSFWALLKHGCLIKQYTNGEFYKIPRVLMGGVITQKRLERLIRKYNDSQYIHLLKNKNEFNSYFSQWVHRKWLWSRDMSQEQLAILVVSSKRLFIKPLDDQEGHGIRVIKTAEVSDIKSLYDEICKENVMIEEAIVQHADMNFNNSAVNTVRMITCLDTKGEAHILRAALRVGIGNSVIDNFTAGGALYNIDIASGRIDNKGIGHDHCTYIYHPGTDICMLGRQLPNWRKAVEGVCYAAKQIPRCRFVGWDVAIVNDGIELIEGNHNPGLFTMESVGKPYAYKDALKYLNA